MMEKLRDNLAGIAAAALFAWIAGYAQGTNTTATIKARQDATDEVVKRNTTQLNARRVFVTDAKDRIEYLCNKDAECRARFQPMQTPE